MPQLSTLNSRRFNPTLNFIAAPTIEMFSFAHSWQNLSDMPKNLRNVLRLIENSTLIGKFCYAPVASEWLNKIDYEFTKLEGLFQRIGILGSMIISLQLKMRTILLWYFLKVRQQEISANFGFNSKYCFMLNQSYIINDNLIISESALLLLVAKTWNLFEGVNR